jgi:hypothetical protein
MDNNRNNRIEEVLSSLDGAKRAGAPDFFYTRLRARMEKSLNANNSRNWLLRPVYIVTALVLVIAVNIFVFLKGQDETATVTADNNESVQQSIAAEYSLNDVNTVYDLNQEK